MDGVHLQLQFVLFVHGNKHAWVTDLVCSLLKLAVVQNGGQTDMLVVLMESLC